ncbi:MAG: HYR domain-containing protein, partial [Bacteroidota bacterium]
EEITRSYRVEDDCGNSILVYQTITVNDVTPPTASNPAPVNVECAADVPAPDISVVTDEADNCTAAPVVAFVSDVSDGNTCPEEITRTYSVTDDCGNSINVTQTITVNDVTIPTAVCQDITVQLDATGNVTIEATDIDNGSNDNCSIDTMWLDRYDFDCTDLGLNTVNLTVRDACGLESTCSATVTVQDNLDPDLTCPADFNEFVDINDDFIIPDYTGLVVVSDNCNPSPALTQDPVDGTVINGVGTIQTITITAEDGNGNNSQCTFDITLIDSLTLSITCPADLDEYVDADCEFVIPDYTGLATTTGAVSVSQDPAPGTVISGHGTVQAITLTALDGGGNSEQCTFNVTLLDDTPPVISGCPADISTVSDTSYCGAEVSWVEPIVSDNCPGVVLTSSHNPGDFFPVGTTTVTYTATDAAGLTDICSFDVIVADASPPVINGPTEVCTPVQEAYSVADPGSHSFSWVVTNGTISGSAINPEVFVDWIGTTPGTVEVTITSGSGCASTNSITVDQHATPVTGNVNSSNSLTRR